MRRQRLAPIAVLLAVLLVACGDDASGTPTTIAATGSSGTIHISGGIAGIDETWVLAADGTILGPGSHVGLLTADQRARLEAAIVAAGFFDLDSEYLPEDPCCDRFNYEVTITSGGRTHTVATIDGADAPESLFTLIGTFLEVVRPAA